MERVAGDAPFAILRWHTRWPALTRPGDDDVSLLRRVWPDQGEVIEMTPNRWKAFLEGQSWAYDCGGKNEV